MRDAPKPPPPGTLDAVRFGIYRDAELQLLTLSLRGDGCEPVPWL